MEKSQVQIIDLQKTAKENAIEGVTENLAESFKPFFSEAQEIMQASAGVKVENLGQTAEMGLARKYRLRLKEIRVGAEKKRKELKEESLRTGRAIDGLNNLLLYKIKPVEEYLEKQENYGLELRKKEQENTRFEREQAAGIYLPFFPANIHLGEIAEEDFEKYFRFAKMEFEEIKRKESEAEAEKLRLEAERRAMEEENARLREEAAQMAAKLDAERKGRERVEAEQRESQRIEAQRIENERREKEAAERKERERIAKEAAEKESAELAALQAPDIEKMKALAAEILELKIPELSDRRMKDILDSAKAHLSHAYRMLNNAK